MVAVALLAAALGAGTLRASAAGAPHSCGWLVRISGDQLNVAFPDQAAKYWVGRLVIPPGGKIEISGQFPHARYISFITYTARTSAIDGLADIHIAPDRGSVNPFVARANRRAVHRSYHLFVKSGAAPKSGREPNTIYTDDGHGKSSVAGGVFVYRVYEADRGLDITGGVGLPAMTTITSSGQRIPSPTCPDLSLPDLGVTQVLANAGLGSGAPAVSRSGLGGHNPPQWSRFTGLANSVAGLSLNNDATGKTLWPPIQKATNSLPGGGFFENLDNKYMTTAFTPGFGPVAVFRGRAWLTPRTYDGQRRMGPGQLRYFSFCTNTAATNYLGCLNDDAIPVDRHGNYRLVISTAANRPSNAHEGCGMAWLPAGPTPQTIVILRNMLPAPSFHRAVQDATQGTEAKTLGPYYPRGRYYSSPTAVEKLGCRHNRS